MSLSELNIHPNQQQAGGEILDYFYDGINQVILLAEMQSGKTGTMRYVVYALQHLKGPAGWSREITPSNTFFICGMNDNDLRGQAIAEFRNFIPKTNILFSKQLQKVNGEQCRFKPELVLIDESHYASLVNSQVDKFIRNYVNSDTLVLSVSATAMAELAVGQTKGKVFLRPGKGYYSMKELFRRGLIRQSADITKCQQSFIDLVTEEYMDQREHRDLKYNIVRLPNQWYYKDLQDDLVELDLDIEFINHHTCTGMSASDFNDYVKNPPKKFTIIWIYGALRAGKQLNTSHIGFVHDTSHSGPDVIAQSLLGRILGYNKAGHGVRCYTDLKSAKLMLTWVESVYDVMKIPQGSKNIVGGYSANSEAREWECNVPILVALDKDTRSYYRTLKHLHGNRYPYKNDMFIDIVLTATTDRDKLVEIFDTYQPGGGGGLMIMTEKNKHKSYSSHWISNLKAYKNGKLVHCCNETRPGKYFYVYANLNIESYDYGLVLVTYKSHVSVGGTRGKVAVNVNPKSRYMKK